MKSLELNFKLVQNDFTCREDVLICAVHCFLTNHSFGCIGIPCQEGATTSSRKESPQDGPGSELLPSGWNKAINGTYCLQYRLDSQVYLLKIIKDGTKVIINMLRELDSKLASIEIKLSSVVSDDYSTFASAYLNLPSFEQTLQNQFLNEFAVSTSGTERNRGHQIVFPNDDLDSRLREPSRFGTGGVVGVGVSPVGVFPPPVGGSDLNPFGGHEGGGGMFMDHRDLLRGRGGYGGRGGLLPFQPGANMPPGAVPPGARFDPFGPPGVPGPGAPGQRPPGRGQRQPGEPDPDHMRPPGYDDMFM